MSGSVIQHGEWTSMATATFVADASGEVYRVSPQGEVELAVDVGETVNDVLVSRSGHIYIPDYYNHTILRSVDPVTRK
jgi:hypothetical protein